MTTAVGNKAQAASWTLIQWLLLFGGVASLLVVLYFTIRYGFDVGLLFFGLPGVSALAAFWQVRAGKIQTAWWVALVAALLSVVYFVEVLLTDSFIPVYSSLLITSFLPYIGLSYLLQDFAMVALIVAGVWALVLHLRGGNGKPSPQPVGATPAPLFDAEGNRVVIAYAVQTSSLAIVAFVLVWLITPVGLILGYVARSEIRNSGGTKSGEGLASAAIILGWIFVAISVIVIFAIMA